MHLSLRLAFYIRIELDRSNVDGRSFQAYPDKMLCFQGLYGFRRDSPAFLNDCKAIENTGQTGFFGISDDSSQIVVTVISLPEQHFRKNIKTRCLQNYKQRIFICRSIIKIVSNHILGGGYQLAKMVKLAAPPVIIRGNFHLLTPFPWGVSRMILSVVRGLCWPWSADRLLFHLIFCRK